MVDDRTTDGKRIAQLLASELTGLETGPLADVAVTDAMPDVTPTPEGARAYDIEYREATVGSVVVYPERATVQLAVDPSSGSEVAIPARTTDDGIVLRVESGVAVKRAVDAIRTILAAKG